MGRVAVPVFEVHGWLVKWPARWQDLIGSKFHLRRLGSKRGTAVLVLPTSSYNGRLLRCRYAAAGLVLVPYRAARVVSYSRRDEDGGEAYSRSKAYQCDYGRYGFGANAGDFWLFPREVVLRLQRLEGGTDRYRYNFECEREEACFSMVLRLFVHVRRFRHSRVCKAGCGVEFFADFSMCLREELPIRFGDRVRRVSPQVGQVEEDVYPTANRIGACEAASPCGLVKVGVRLQVAFLLTGLPWWTVSRGVRYLFLFFLTTQVVFRFRRTHPRRPIVRLRWLYDVVQRYLKRFGSRVCGFVNDVFRVRLVRGALLVVI